MTLARALDHVAPEDRDPLDAQLHRVGPAPAGPRGAMPWHLRLGLTWSSGSPPAVLLLLVGAALGPSALDILTPAVLSAIDPALPVALAALGVHTALTVPMSRAARDHALLRRASVESLFTGPIVAGGILLVQMPDLFAPTLHAWLIALGCGVCAATSARLPSEDGTGAQTAAMRLQQLDVVLPIVAGGLLLAWAREGSMLPALLLAGQAALLAVTVAVAGWLLLSRPVPENESRIFGVAALLLVGGLADYLSLSALLSGLVAGTFWRLVAGGAGDRLRRDVRQLQHPLVALILIVAGAHVQVTSTVLSLALAYLLLRLVGKLAGGALVRRGYRGLPASLGLTLVTPGIFGIALALNTVRSAGPQSELLLGVVVLGTIGSQLIAAFRRPREDAA
jgi:hypothetical protein